MIARGQDLNKSWSECWHPPHKSHGPFLLAHCWILMDLLHPAQQGSGFLLAIFTKVCFFPSLHSRVYPEWFNYNFPCVRQIKEESRSVVPSTLFISLTDCSSPNPWATAAAAAHRGCRTYVRGRQEWEDGGFQMAWGSVSQVRALHIPRLKKKKKFSLFLSPANSHTQHL